MIRWLKLTCEDTSPLISEMMDHSLPLSKKIRVRIHLAMCGVCRCYQNQLDILRALAKKLGSEDCEATREVRLREEYKKMLKDKLKIF